MLTDSTCVSCRVSTARSLIGMIVNAFACMARSVDRAPRTAAAAAAVDVACTGSVPWEGQLSDPGHSRPWMLVEFVLAQKPRCGGPIVLPRAQTAGPGCSRCREPAGDTSAGLLAIRTLALLTGFWGAKRGANDHRVRATPGHMQPLAPRPNGTSGHMQHRTGTLRKCLLSSRSRVRVAVGAQVRLLNSITPSPLREAAGSQR